MNVKEQKAKDFLKLNKLLQELRYLRYNYMGTDNDKRVQRAIAELEPMLEELRVWLESAIKPLGDYDI